MACPSPKLYLHLVGLPTSALFGFAPGQTGSGTHGGSQFPGEESPDRTIQTRPRALFTGFSSGDRALSSAAVTMMQSAKSLARSHVSQRCGRNPAVWSSLAQSEMCPVLMIQLDNATPIILNREKSFTHGTLGTLAL